MRVDKVRMEKEDIQAKLNIDPFPHVIIDNFYNVFLKRLDEQVCYH